jgi:hypothetical protein
MKSRFESEKNFREHVFSLSRGTKKPLVCNGSLTTPVTGEKLTNYESTGNRNFHTNKLGEAKKMYPGEFSRNVKPIKKKEPQIDTDSHRTTGIGKKPVEIRVTLWAKKRRSKMGSREPYSLHDKKAVSPVLETNIAVLLNSVYYFLQHVFIIVREDDYRLVVLHNNRILTDSHYETLRGAKIAFYKMYSQKAWKMDVRANWSPIYNPDSDWLNAKHKLLKKGRIQSVH